MSITWALLRVSTEKDQSPASQKLTIETYCASRVPPIVVERWLGEDVSVSGGAAERPDLDEILAAAMAQPRLIDRLVVSSEERIGRRGPTTSIYVERLHELGVKIVAVEQGGVLDLATPEGRLLSRIKSAVAAYFRECIGPKTRPGMDGWEIDGAAVPKGTPFAIRVSLRKRKKIGNPALRPTPEQDETILRMAAQRPRPKDAVIAAALGTVKRERAVDACGQIAADHGTEAVGKAMFDHVPSGSWVHDRLAWLRDRAKDRERHP